MPPRAFIYETSTDPYAFRRATLRPAPRFRPGQRVKLPAELGGATATVVDRYLEPGLWQVKVGSLDFVISEHAMKKAAPQWRAGDVVVVRFNGPTSTPYTYCRAGRMWPGETRSMNDAEIDKLYLAGKAKPVLQAGGEPFDEGRL